MGKEFTKTKINTIDGYYMQGGYGVARSIAKDSNGRIWIAYFEIDSVGSSLYAAYSDTGGKSWTEEKAVDDCDFQSSSPGISLVIDSGDVPHILFLSEYGIKGGKVYHTSRSGGVWPGATGGKASCTLVFTSDPPGTSFVYGVAACIDSQDNIHLVGSGGGHGIFYFKYTASTETWGSEVTVGTGGNRVCQIVVDSSGNPHVAYAGGILLHHSADGGASFGSYDTELYAEASGVNAGNFDMAIGSDDTLHFAFIFDNVYPNEVRYVSGKEGSWGSAVTLAAAVELYTDYWYGPAIALDLDNSAYVIYQLNYSSATSDDGVYYVKVTAGVAGSQETLVSSEDITYPGTGGYQMPSIIAGLWQRYPGSSILSSKLCPTAALLDVSTQFGADVYFVTVKSKLKGNPHIDQRMFQHVERMGR